MTHGEEPGPETHQDSAVLTYLEGLLMHPVATGPGATATRRQEAGHSNEEQGNKVDRGLQLPNHDTSPPEKSSPPGTASQHLKKARLLRSGAWSEPEVQKLSAPVVEVNGQSREHQKAALDGSTQGESTLLASLLQSFSSRLQSVAMSQSVAQNHKQPEEKGGASSPSDKDSFRCYGTASSRLKGLMRKNKLQNHNSVPYSRRGSQDRHSESPRSTQSSTQPPTPDSGSCAERLKAVANLVKNRTSPAPSPKPSVACSQLALLLSSEAHLQQYSREQALKAQLSGRSASDRLAAIATQQTQDNRPPSMGESPSATDMLSSLNSPNGALPTPALNSIKRSPSLNSGHSRASSSPNTTPHQPKEKRPFDRPGGRPVQNCSSLLLLLLNNHNSQKQLTKNGHLGEDFGALPSRASSLHSDSEYSNQENSLTKDSSDAESCYSSCSPIDLSMRSRVASQKSEPPSSASSLDKLTESLINKWKPEAPGPKVPEARELDQSPDMKSHHKVTLMQLLLDRRNNEKVNKIADNPDLQHDATLSNMPVGSLKRIGIFEDSRTQSPLERLTGGSLATFGPSGDSSSNPSPYPYSSPHIQASPLDLCKPKPYPNVKMTEPPFSASKLLQNLAQSGLRNPSPSPPLQTHSRPPSKRQSPELDMGKPQSLLDHVVAPIKRNHTPGLEGLPATFSPFRNEQSPPAPSQIENLLERRTVLQLLLGSASHKEKFRERRSSETAGACFEKPPGGSVICDSSNRPSLDIKIKTEPGEEGPPSDSSNDGTRCPTWEGYERQSPLVEHQDIKPEPCPPESMAKYGLLSQLLKQQSATYQTSTHTQHQSAAVKEEPRDYQGPIPKKRRLCMELAEHLSGELCQKTAGTFSEHFSPANPEEHNGRRLTSPKEEDLLLKGPASKGVPRDSQGFNVLKQLLLSDNCLKELAPPLGSSSPQATSKANGNFLGNQYTYNHELADLPWPPHALTSAEPGHLKPPSTTTAANSTRSSPWTKGSPKSKPHAVKKETDSSPGWTLSGEEKRDSSPDSPRLTRSNPILYYMLQRGNGQLRREMVDQGQMTHCGISIKDEPRANARDYEHRLRALQRSPALGEKHGKSGEHLNGSVEKW